MMENVIDNLVNVDFVDSLDEKMEDSVNSRDSSMYFFSVEQLEFLQDVIEIMEIDDSLFLFNLIKLLFEILKMLELVVEELELESKFIDVLFKQKFYGFIFLGDFSCAEFELKKDVEVIEIFLFLEFFDFKLQFKFFVLDIIYTGDFKDFDVVRLEVLFSCIEQIIGMEFIVKNINEVLLKDKIENDGVLQKTIVSKILDNLEVINVIEELSVNIQIFKSDFVLDVKGKYFYKLYSLYI